MKPVFLFALLLALISGLTIHAHLPVRWHRLDPKPEIDLDLGNSGSGGSLVGQANQANQGNEGNNVNDEDDSEGDSEDGFGSTWTLEFDHTIREGKDPETSSFTVEFNDQLVKSFVGGDNQIHHQTLQVTTKPGKNKLSFTGQGKSDTFGATITNVQLTRTSKCGLANAIINGKFDQGHKLAVGHGDRSRGIFNNNVIPGWNTNLGQMEIGWGQMYSSKWAGDVYVCELDVNRNTQVYQEFELDSNNRLPTEKCE